MTKPEEDEVLQYFSSIKPRREDKGAFWMGVGLVLLALCIPANQSLLWLQMGYWTPLPIANGIQFLRWHVPSTDWTGPQKIIAWLFNLPLWSMPAFMAFGCFSAWKETV